MLRNNYIRQIKLLTLFLIFACQPFMIKAQSIDSELDSLCQLQNKETNAAKRYNLLKEICTRHPNNEEISKYSSIGYDLSKNNRDTAWMAYFAKMKGYSSYQRGRYFESKYNYKESLKLYRELGNMAEVGDAISCIGNLFFETDKFEDGINYKFQALKIFDDICDTTKITSVYRTIGIYSIRFQQFSFAKEYIDKAITMDSLSKNQKNYGRNMLLKGILMMQSKAKPELSELMEIKNCLDTSYKIAKADGDYLYMTNASSYLSMQYAELYIKTSNWKYADSSLLYYNESKNLISKTGIKENENNIEYARAVNMILAGNSNDAFNILTKLENKQKKTYNQDLMLFKVFDIYYRFNKDYMNMLNYLEKKRITQNKLYISEYMIKFEKAQDETEFEITMNNIDKNEKKRNEIMKIQETSHQKQVLIEKIIGAMLILLIVVLALSSRHEKKVISSTKRHNQEILKFNKELDTINNEALSQSQQIENQIKEIKRQRNRLASYNLKIVLMMDRASRRQIQVMPSPEKMQSIFKEIFILWRPLDMVSGDFYWGTEINGLKFLAVADCTGHGIPGACISMLGIALINSIIVKIDTETVTAAEILNMLRERIIESLSRGHTIGDIHDGMDMSLCIIDKKKQKLSYAGAYRPLWIASENKITEFKADRMPVALDEDHKEDFTNNEIAINANDCIYMFSDGITDQFGIVNGKMQKFKHKRLRAILEANCSKAIDEQKTMIENELDSWSSGQAQTDDIIMIGVKIS